VNGMKLNAGRADKEARTTGHSTAHYVDPKIRTTYYGWSD